MEHGDMISIDDFFERFLCSKKNIVLLEGYYDYAVTCSVHFPDADKTWFLEIADGALHTVKPCVTDECTARVKIILSQCVFNEIIRKERSAQQAFFQKDADVQGDVFEGMKFVRVLTAFLDAHPYVQQIDKEVQVPYEQHD